MPAAVYELGSNYFEKLPTRGSNAGQAQTLINFEASVPTTTVDDIGDIVILAKAEKMFNPTRFVITGTDADSGGPTLVYSIVLTNARYVGIATATNINVITGITSLQSAGVYDTDTLAYATKALLLKYVAAEGYDWALLVTAAATTPAAYNLHVKIEGVAYPAYAYGLTAFS